MRHQWNDTKLTKGRLLHPTQPRKQGQAQNRIKVHQLFPLLQVKSSLHIPGNYTKFCSLPHTVLSLCPENSSTLQTQPATVLNPFAQAPASCNRSPKQALPGGCRQDPGGCTHSVCPRQKDSMQWGAADQLTRIFSSRSAVSTKQSSGLRACESGGQKRARSLLASPGHQEQHPPSRVPRGRRRSQAKALNWLSWLLPSSCCPDHQASQAGSLPIPSPDSIAQQRARAIPGNMQTRLLPHSSTLLGHYRSQVTTSRESPSPGECPFTAFSDIPAGFRPRSALQLQASALTGLQGAPMST